MFLLKNSAEIGHGVPCCNARQTRVVRHKLAVDIGLVASVTRCCPETESHFLGRKIAKSKNTLLNRHCALDFDWPGVIKEQTLHESAHSKQIQIDYRSIDRCSNPPPLPSLLCPFSVLPPSLPSRQNQGASEKMVCGVQTAAPIRYDTDSESPSPAGSARKHGAALSSRQSTAASPQNSVPDGASRRW